jgi:alkanesulfonate monooxygenase SsuD/methylene tetrahydromethanopterin reductase-like flavin-dependent oxidoreductase (luciferase family)
MSPLEMAQWATAAENSGFESVWVTEAFWDAIVPLTLMSQTTSRVRLGAACAIVARNPHPAQMAWAGIDEVSQGRLVIGLADGPSGPNANWWGTRPQRPVQRMREHVELIRLMLASHADNVDYQGRYYVLRDFQRWALPMRERIPILIGATRPPMLRLAGEIADGYIGAALNSTAYFHDIVMPSLEQGLERSGRTRDDLELAAVRICSIDNDVHRAREIARRTIAFYAGIAPRLAEVLDHEGFSSERRDVESAFLIGDIEAAAASIPDEAVDRLALAGTPDMCREHLAGFARDFDTVILYPPALGLDKGAVEEHHRVVIETFASVGAGV